jgi:hypothetical protein
MGTLSFASGRLNPIRSAKRKVFLQKIIFRLFGSESWRRRVSGECCWWNELMSEVFNFAHESNNGRHLLGGWSEGRTLFMRLFNEEKQKEKRFLSFSPKSFPACTFSAHFNFESQLFWREMKFILNFSFSSREDHSSRFPQVLSCFHCLHPLPHLCQKKKSEKSLNAALRSS